MTAVVADPEIEVTVVVPPHARTPYVQLLTSTPSMLKTLREGPPKDSRNPVSIAIVHDAAPTI
jgi:hypothetical protein